MKTTIIYSDTTKTSAEVIMAYDEKITPSQLCEHVYLLLETACEMDGYKLKFDLYEITEESGVTCT